MMKIAVLVSGNGSNLQALIDAQCAQLWSGEIVGVISNKADAYALKRNNKPISKRKSLNIKLTLTVKCLMMPCINNLYSGVSTL